MKVKANKILSVALSLVLVLSCLLPALQFVTFAEGDDDAIKAIKDAWQSMDFPGTKEIYGDAFYAKTAANNNWHKYTSNITTENLDGLDLKVVAPADANKGSFIVMPESARAVGTTDKYIDIDDYSEIYFYYKAPSGYNEVQLGACPQGGGINDSIKVNLPATTGEEYAKFDVLAAIKNSAKVGYFDGSGNTTDGVKRWFAGRVHFGNGSIGFDGISVSQLIYAEKPDVLCPSDEKTKDWELIDWYSAASAVDFTGYTGFDAEKVIFNNAIKNAFNVLKSTEKGTIELIKDGIYSLTWDAEPITDAMYNKVGNNWTDYVGSTSVEAIDDREVTVTDFNNAAGGAIIMSQSSASPVNVGRPSVYFDTDDYDEMFLYYKSSGSVTYQLAYSDTNGGNMASAAFSLPAADTLTKLDIYNIMVNHKDADCFNGENLGRVFFRFHISSGFNNVSATQIYGKQKPYLKFGIDEEESKTWDLEKWLSVATEIDLSEFGNTEMLSSLLASFEAEPAIKAIMNAWENLKPITHSEIYSDNYYATTETNTAWHEYTSNVTTKNLGGMNLKVGQTKDTKQFILMPKSAAAVGKSDQLIDIDDYEEIYFYYKTSTDYNGLQLGAADTNGSIFKAKAVKLSATGNEYEKFDVLSALNVGVDKGYFDGTGNNNDNKVSFFSGRIHFSQASDVEISQVVVRKKASNMMPTKAETVNWKLGDWYFAATELDLSFFEGGAEKTAFEKLLVDTKEILLQTDDGKAALIKALWSKLEIPARPLWNYWYEKTTGAWKAFETKGGTATQIEGELYLPTVHPTEAEGGIVNMSIWREGDINKINFTDIVDIDEYNEIYFYYKSPVELKGVQMAYCGASGDVLSSKTYQWGTSPNGFTKVDLKTSFTSGPQANCYNGNEGYLMRMHFSDVENLPNGAYITPVMAVPHWTKEFDINLEETDEWTVSDWIVNASAYDLTKYGNSEELSALIKQLGEMDMNLIAHAPVEAYRTDADGNSALLDATEFGIQNSSLMYDGDLTAAINLPRNGCNIDVVYNLSKLMDIREVGLSTASPNIKGFKVYASNVKAGIWEEGALIYEYKAEDGAELETTIMHMFSKAPRMRYIRFSIIDTEIETIDLTEIHVRGARKQELLYKNVATSSDLVIDAVLQDKSNYKYSVLATDANRFGTNSFSGKVKFEHITDKKTDTVYDFMMGTKNKESFNLLFDFGRTINVDKFELVCGSEEYFFPSEMNLYIGETDAEIFSKDAKLVRNWDSATEDGIYSEAFNPIGGQYLRVEILDNDCTYYNDYIMTVIAEIAIYGVDLVGSGSGDAVASFTDDKTGIITEVIARSGNDVFEEINDAKVVASKPTAAQIAAANSFGMGFVTDFYKITLLDYANRPLKDVGGRRIRISVPMPEGVDMNTAYWGVFNADGSFSILEHSVDDIGDITYLMYEFTDLNELCVVIATYNEYQDDFVPYPDETPAEDTPVYGDDTPLEDMNNSQDIPDIDDETEEETAKPSRVKKVYKYKKPVGGLSTLAIVGIVVGSVVLAAGITLGVILIVKKKKRNI